MKRKKKETFWFEDMYYLVDSIDILPKFHTSSFESQMNRLTRFILVLFFFFFIFNITRDWRILFFLLFLTIVIYYSIQPFHEILHDKKQQPIKEHYSMRQPSQAFSSPVLQENYGNVPTVTEPIPPIPWNTNTNAFVFTDNVQSIRQPCSVSSANGSLPSSHGFSLSSQAQMDNPQLVDSNQSLAWCPRSIPIQETISLNQSLVGPANPKTLVAPVIPPPIYQQKQNDFIFFPQINDQRRQELSQNGYMTFYPSPVSGPMYPPSSNPYSVPLQENYSNEEKYNFSSPVGYQVKSNQQYSTLNIPSIDTQCGYQPSNLDYGLPINYSSNQCQRTEQATEYNKNLFRIPIQPGIYTTNQVNNPGGSMYNLGISHQDQFQPYVVEKKKDFIEFQQYDPNLYPGLSQPQSSPSSNGQRQIFRNEINDPRLTGYGTSYRSYVDPLLGQPRYFYRDVDTWTQPDYITRNQLDFTSIGTSVGPLSQTPLQGQSLYSCADNTFTDSTIDFRTELQQRLMNKNSEREWQQRMFPISTQNRAGAGGGKSSASTYAGPRGG